MSIPRRQTTPRAQRGRRLTSLDGLRGFSAVIVLIHHAALTQGPFAAGYFDKAPEPAGTFWWWMTATPLKIFTAGGEFVVVFFVLSGFVLYGLVRDIAGMNWPSYFAGRLLRLWLPAAASVFLAVGVVAVTNQNPKVAASDWLEFSANQGVPSLARILNHLDMIRGDVGLNSPLWSIQFEIIFSLLLPIFALIARRCSHRPFVTIAVCAVVSALAGFFDLTFMVYAPAFAAGCAISAARDQGRLTRTARGTVARVLLAGGTVLALIGLVSRWLLWGVAPTQTWLRPLSNAPILIGAAVLVIAALEMVGFRRVLESRAGVWLGKVSFSLYLVHVPIIVGTAYMLGSVHTHWVPLVGMVFAVAVTIPFYYCVERPSHRLSRWVASFVRGANQREVEAT